MVFSSYKILLEKALQCIMCYLFKIKFDNIILIVKGFRVYIKYILNEMRYIKELVINIIAVVVFIINKLIGRILSY